MRAALLYTLLALMVAAFQAGLALGMPWGALAMGGAFPGAYPPRMRVAAGAAVVIVLALAWVVRRAAGGAGWAQRGVWGVVALMALGLALNLASPSRSERALWSPVVAVMLAAALSVARRA